MGLSTSPVDYAHDDDNVTTDESAAATTNGGGGGGTGTATAGAYEDFESSYEDDDVEDGRYRKQHRKSKTKPKKKRKHQSSSSSSSADDDDDSSSDDNSVTAVKKKKKKVSSTKVKSGSGSTNKKVSSSGQRSSPSADSFANLINAAVKSHKKQEQSKLIEEVKSDVMGLIQNKLFGTVGGGGSSTGGKKDKTSAADPEPEVNDGGADYLKRIRSAYKECKHHKLAIGGKFNSKEHKSNISSLFNRLDEVQNIDLKRIPYLDKILDINSVVSGPASDRLKLKKLTSADIQSCAEKVIPEAEYASLTDAYGACILYRYFFSILKPYLNIPYISS